METADAYSFHIFSYFTLSDDCKSYKDKYKKMNCDLKYYTRNQNDNSNSKINNTSSVNNVDQNIVSDSNNINIDNISGGDVVVNSNPNCNANMIEYQNDDVQNTTIEDVHASIQFIHKKLANESNSQTW